ncbi:proteasome assembly chaperone 2 [Pyrrhoderma noxium]|uniref:Proteasome assembly chaperone 2 n=1 Tax=Pyrrhoderma noxium TaxID=2282107 RepID=A0A286UHJ3_9AGAM|nr:proteasome assembly chaperone 2 [Pyrrhoderma noxium]
MTFYYPLSDSITLKSKTLIVPVVSAGNVAQLAVDLLISTLKLEQIGVFDSRDLIPVAGGREDGPGISTPLELYGKDGIDVVVIQQRSPILKSHKDAFTSTFSNFIKESQFSAVLLLSGVDLSNRSDSQMNSPTYSLLGPGTANLESSPLSLLSQLPKYTFSPSQGSVLNMGPVPIPTSTDPAPLIPLIPGGGLTRRFLSLSSSLSNIQIAAILQFVLEGDNRNDAEYFASVVSGILKLGVKPGSWVQPESWKVGLFGTPHDQALYG